MLMTQELADKITAAYNEFVATANAKSIRYINSQANCDVLRKCMKDNDVPDETLALREAWTLVWVQASAAGLLEEPAAPKTAAQEAAERQARVSRLEARDRAEGIRAKGYRSEADIEAERQAAIDAHNKSVDDRKAAQAAAVKSREAAEAVEAAKNDLSVVPTVEALRANPLSLAEESAFCKKLSVPQLKRFIQNRDAAIRLNVAAAQDARRKGSGQ